MTQLTIAQEKDLVTIAKLATVIWNDHYVSGTGRLYVG